jgi:2-oxoisovalerate dehydrogenase E1 component alpha subunit
MNKLNVPAPKYRPGDAPNFDNMMVGVNQDLSKPAIDSEPMDMIDHAIGLVRVLNDEGELYGDWIPDISDEELLKGLSDMMLTRIYDDRMQVMQRIGKMSFYLKCTGEEAIAIAQTIALEDQDMCFASYRQQGILIARGFPLLTMMNHCLSNSKDICKGRQLPIMYTWSEGNYFTISGNLGTQFPQAVGWAMASAYKGENAVASTWIGDGTTATNDFHQGMTFASVYKAPALLNVVNNQWAISSFQGFAAGEHTTFASRGIGYGVPGIRVDGNDFLAVYAVTKWAAMRARAGHGSTLIEHFTYRAAAHSTSDDPSKYRPENEQDFWPFGDPIDRLKAYVIKKGIWSEDQDKELTEAHTKKVFDAYKEAESYGTLSSGVRPDISTIFEDIFEEPTSTLRRQRQELGI